MQMKRKGMELVLQRLIKSVNLFLTFIVINGNMTNFIIIETNEIWSSKMCPYGQSDDIFHIFFSYFIDGKGKPWSLSIISLQSVQKALINLIITFIFLFNRRTIHWQWIEYVAGLERWLDRTTLSTWSKSHV